MSLRRQTWKAKPLAIEKITAEMLRQCSRREWRLVHGQPVRVLVVPAMWAEGALKLQGKSWASWRSR